MRFVLPAIFLALLGGLARAEDDDDDPKSGHSTPVKVEPKPPVKVEPKPPVKVEPKPAPARAEPKVEARPAPPRAEPKAEPRPEPPTAVAKVEPRKKPAAVMLDPEMQKPLVDPFPVPGRNVRVRLLDGSNVAGLVRAELSESLVIECNLGLLSIPRIRISTISYDAGGGAKRAPVQQLDDDLPPRKR